MGLECLASTTMLFSPCHEDIQSHTKLGLPSALVKILFFFVVMTSWQNILDHLPTGTGRPVTQSNSRSNDEFAQKTPNYNINNSEGIYSHCNFFTNGMFHPSVTFIFYLTDPSRSRPARERHLVFLPRKRNVVPKFNLLGLKPTENFQPYRMGFFQPHGLGE